MFWFHGEAADEVEQGFILIVSHLQPANLVMLMPFCDVNLTMEMEFYFWEMCREEERFFFPFFLAPSCRGTEVSCLVRTVLQGYSICDV